MKLASTYRIPASRENVFAALTDPAVLQQCIEGCESLTRKEDGSYAAKMRVGVGPVKGDFTGTARMSDLHPPESFTLIVNGRGTPGFVDGSARMRLTTDGTATIVSCDADVTVGGLIAAVGSRLIDVTAKRMMDKFFEALRGQVARSGG
jgi:carbon monoxide dehydrogenase subunit G